MVKLTDLPRRKRRNPDFRKCAAIAAVVAAVIVFGIELAGGGPVGQAKAGMGVQNAGAAPTEARMPAEAR